MDVSSRGRKLSFDLLADESLGENDLRFSRIIEVEESGGNAGSFKVNKRRRKRNSTGSKHKGAVKGFVGDVCHKTDFPAIEVVANQSDLISGDIIGPGGALDVTGNQGVFAGECLLYHRIQSCVDRPLLDTSPLVTDGGGSVQTICAETSFEDSSFLKISSVELRKGGVDLINPDTIPGFNPSEDRAAMDISDHKVLLHQSDKRRSQTNVNGAANSLDWKTLTADDDSSRLKPMPVDKFPLRYLSGEMQQGNSLRVTTSVGNEKKRQKVYNTMFHVPWRCELVIDVGFFVCLDSFLSLLTIMPARIFMTFCRFLNMRKFQRPCAADLSDVGCFVVLVFGVMLLEATDISLIYHIIRGQGTLKLYVVYNVLEIFDKLFQSFGGDVVQVLFNSAEGVASCSPENMTLEVMRFMLDQTIAVLAFIVHSFILLAQAITLSTCIVAHNNALLALLVSNNFSELKSSVFKHLSKEDLHKMVYYDTVERFHITAYLLFVLAQNILEAEGAWLASFLANAVMVYMCEVLIDIIKHSFLAKFNEVKPEVYSEFLEDLCKQTLGMEQEEGKKKLTFIPLAPACVVIRVLTPIYAAQLPYSSFWWRMFWMFALSSFIYVAILTIKVIIGMSLQFHAAWYINRRRSRKKSDLHFD